MDNKTSFSNRLRIKLQMVHEIEKDNAISKSINNVQYWYKNYLIITYSIMCSSVPLMKAAFEKCTRFSKEEKMMDGLVEYYKKHIQEEMNHDEWILDDLQSIGVPREESLSRKPLQSVAELVGSQYYWIYHWHPVCLLGYISFLEGDPPTKNLIDGIQKITGYSDIAFRTMIKHSDLDLNHRDELNDLLDKLPLDKQHEQWITYNALYSANKLLDIRNQSAV
jgi:hypothetical protein